MKYVQLCLVIYLCISFAYDPSCPDPSQVHLRRKVCNNGTDEDSKYACLVDTNKNYTFRESCDEGEPYLVRPGRRYVFSGSSTDDSCSHNRYQPVPFSKAMYSMCILLKSTCNELGQVLSSNTSGLEDSTCRCDHSTGYTYVNKPKDIYKCIPSEEDCTCYRKQCPSNGCLSADYYCLEDNITQCSSIFDTSLSPIAESVPRTTVDITTQLKGQIDLYHSKSMSLPIVLLFVCALTAVVIFYRIFPRVFPKREDHLDVKIIGHWKSLKRAMDPTELISLLNKEGLVGQTEIDEQKYKSPDWQKNYSLIKVLKACTQDKYVNKCKKIMTAQMKLDVILRRPIQVPKWHKRGVAICRKRIEKMELLLKEMLDIDEVMDYFMESFFFTPEKYEAIMSSSAVEKLDKFLKELYKTLNRGSFECLLTALEKSEAQKLSPVLDVLKTGLVQASLKQGTFFGGLKNEVLQVTKKVCLSIEPMTTQISERDFQDQYITYFIEEFGLYLEKYSSFTDILLYPIVTDVENRLRRGIQNGALSRLLENLFTNTFDKWSKQETIGVKVMIKFTADNIKDSVTKYVQTSSKHNIFAANKSLIEKELDCEMFVDALVLKGFKDFKNVKKEKNKFFKLLEEKVDDKMFLKTFLKIAGDNMSADALKKLQTYNKVWSADSTKILNKILEMCSTFAEIWNDLKDFNEICTERNILTTKFFEEIEITYPEDKRSIEILVHIVQFGNRDAALALVETLYNNNHDLLASKILFTDTCVCTDKDVASEKIIEKNVHVEDELNTATGRPFFEGYYSLKGMFDPF